MGITEVPDFDIAKAARKRQIGEDGGNPMDRNLLALRRRLQNCIEKCKNNAAKAWYSSKLREMTADQTSGSDAGHKANTESKSDSAHGNDV